MNEVLRYRELIVSGSIDRAILHLGAPAAMAALLQAGFLVVDTFWLGRVGPVALAAASTAGFTMWLAQTVGDGAAAGSGSVLARAIGAENHVAAERTSVDLESFSCHFLGPPNYRLENLRHVGSMNRRPENISAGVFRQVIRYTVSSWLHCLLTLFPVCRADLALLLGVLEGV